MRIHILGICGTFMGGLALLARQLGWSVSGCDQDIYPPMSHALQAAGIVVQEGYDPAKMECKPDLVVIGNSLSRGNPMVEYVLNKGLPYCSGPKWLAEQVLASRHVIAVSGTHGKTTTSSLIAWILTHAQVDCGYLIGGMPCNFEQTANLGKAPYFVVEADEYDSAFFDKRSKFIHYRPRTLIMNNLEFDHADIFPDLEAIKLQFQYLLRTVPGSGVVIYPEDDRELADVLGRGCWSATQTFGTNGAWHAEAVSKEGSAFELWHRDQKLGRVEWDLLGCHNVNNALAAIAAAHNVGITSKQSILALRSFKGVKRRMQLLDKINNITIYDDFAHHPTAIATTIAGLRARVGEKRIVAVLEFSTNTMRQGVYRDQLARSLIGADRVFMLKPEDQLWDVEQLRAEIGSHACVYEKVGMIVNDLSHELQPNDHVLIMSNQSFDNIQERLIKKLYSVSVTVNSDG